MLNENDKEILEIIINHCERIEKKMIGIKEEEFYNDLDLQEIICFNILQIGEVANKLTSKFIKEYNKQPWYDIVGMRNVVVHAYGTIKKDEVWKCASQEMKPLREYCENILQTCK